ncbi:Fanconi anemia group E protein [Gracilinanus agilis]|uniref:Fanconi anemia group E protein n=1 Tax=Gracilinanus agilis TaxID=191870 RepID=UPI001CFE5918|nr:Fanconi anemia group E protein [Gracilinanus agilis]
MPGYQKDKASGIKPYMHYMDTDFRERDFFLCKMPSRTPKQPSWPGAEFDPGPLAEGWVARFRAQLEPSALLLLQLLQSGPGGVLGALRALQRLRAGSSERPFCWGPFLEALSREEPVLEGLDRRLELKPLLLQLPQLCQRNLLSLLLAVHTELPKSGLLLVLQAAKCDPILDTWLQALRGLLQREITTDEVIKEASPLTQGCQERLRSLCRHIRREHRPGHPLDFRGTEDMGTQRPGKRRKDPEMESEDSEREFPKRLRSLEGKGEKEEEEQQLQERTTNEQESSVSGDPASSQRTEGNSDQPILEAVTSSATDSQQEKLLEIQELPKAIKDQVPRILELLETEWEGLEGTLPLELQFLHECSPSQLENLCSQLRLSRLSDTTLLQFCNRLLALSPDLSCSSATILSRILFLEQVLSLTASASRLFRAALTAFCGRYPHPVCTGLLIPALQATGTGPTQTEILCCLLEGDTLESDMLVLVLKQILELPWREETFTVMQSLLGRQMDLSAESFSVLVQKLAHEGLAAPHSVGCAKLVLTVVTKYQDQVTEAHRVCLASAMEFNTTFLKKPLQVALRRLTS